MWACPNVSDTLTVLLRYEQRKGQEVVGFQIQELSALVWSLEMVQKCGGYTYKQGELRGRVGKERGGKETDGCPLTAPIFPPGDIVRLHGSNITTNQPLSNCYSLSKPVSDMVLIASPYHLTPDTSTLSSQLSSYL
jgi:hypothetical protein